MPRTQTQLTIRQRLGVALKAFQMVFSGFGGTGDGPAPGWLRLLLPGADFDYEAQAGDLWRNSAVAACLRVLKVNFPQPALQVTRTAGRGRDNAIDGHPLVRLLNRPNGYYDRFTLWGAFVLSAVVDGNAYLLKVRSAAGIPVELWWVPHWMIRPCWPREGRPFISHYRYTVDGRRYEVDPADVVHYRHGGIDPHNDRLGLADLKAGLRAVCSLNEADGFTASIMRNMGVPAYAIVPTKDSAGLTKEQATQAKQMWRERLTGEERGTPFVSIGPVKVEKLGFSPEEMALDKLPARLEDQVGALTGVNAMVSGLTSGSQHKTYANYGEARRAFYEDTLIPMQAAVAECLQLHLLGDVGLGDRDRESVSFSYAGIACLREEQDAVFARVGKAYQTDKILKRSEARQAIGLEWTPEDEVYAGDAAAPGAPEDDRDDAPAALPAGSVAAVQATALNGAQIASLLAIVQQVVAGQLPGDAARAVIRASFPTLTDAQIEAIIGPAEVFEPESAGAIDPTADDADSDDPDRGPPKGKMAGTFRGPRNQGREYLWAADR